GMAAENPVPVATYSAREAEDKQVAPITGVTDHEDARLIVHRAIDRIRQLANQFFQGFFYLGAIRVPPNYKNLRWDEEAWEQLPEKERGVSLKSRHVGARGEATWFLERNFASNPMAPPDIQFDNPLALNHEIVDGFVSGWADRLLDTQIRDFDLAPGNWKPTGILIDVQPNQIGQHNDELYLIVHPCFGGEPQSPKQMSAGFHQVMPMIVQAALMRRNELMAIENPEVHLHPKLQLDLAEFLMHQAKSGKWVLFETHSDLMIRRVIREILEEQIGLGQANVSINFVGLDNLEESYLIDDSIVAGCSHSINNRFTYSTLEPVEIDNRGRIANWPPGFLDDDVRESRRLLDVMYGPPPSEDEELEE
ncbi:MAG: DUF3696 domain-containing protein, partial [Planctomycetes bacterium]|nr:DUF3696 domain-containing protein [Planctomycetota bacterium]